MTDAENYAEHAQNGDAEAMEDGSNQQNDTREDDRKLFIGGLSWETTEKDLKDFFSKHGEIENVNVKTDPNTGRSRGFAFVVFKTVDAVESVLSSGDLTIHNKKVEAKRAKARQGKIFVGGLPAEVSEDDIKAHFNAFGKVVELEMPYDKVRNQRKGFCFITFETEACLKDVLRQSKQTLGGKEVDVKKATPRNDQMMGGPFMRGGMMRGGRGGMMRGGRGGPRGGFRGGWNGGAGGGGWGGPQQWNQGGGYGGYGDGGYGNYGGGYGGYDSYGGAGRRGP
jgi:squid-like protein